MGYWLCTAFSNVAYGVMLNDSCGAFFPVTAQSWLGNCNFRLCTHLDYVLYCGSGHKTAKFINTLLASVKVVMLLFIIIVFVVFFNTGLFESDVWGFDSELIPR